MAFWRRQTSNVQGVLPPQATEQTGVPYFPQTLPAASVVGRLSTLPGPTEAITLAQLGAAIFSQSIYGFGTGVDNSIIRFNTATDPDSLQTSLATISDDGVLGLPNTTVPVAGITGVQIAASSGYAYVVRSDATQRRFDLIKWTVSVPNTHELFELESGYGLSTYQQTLSLNEGEAGHADSFGGFPNFVALNKKGWPNFQGLTRTSLLPNGSQTGAQQTSYAFYGVGINDYTGGGSSGPSGGGAYIESRGYNGAGAALTEIACQSVDAHSSVPNPYSANGSSGPVVHALWLNPGGSGPNFGTYRVTSGITFTGLGAGLSQFNAGINFKDGSIYDPGTGSVAIAFPTTYQLTWQASSGGAVGRLSGTGTTLTWNGASGLALTGASGGSASPAPLITMGTYFDNTANPSISHIDLLGGTYGFGVSNISSVAQLNYIVPTTALHAFYTGAAPAIAVLNIGAGNGGVVGLNLLGTVSGRVTIAPNATAGTPTLVLPNASGTFAVSASGGLALDATTGNLTISGVAASTLTGTTLASNVVTSSLTAVGTIATGVWNGTVITGQYGGTGVANTGKTITLGGSFTTSGAFTTTFTVTANTSVTLPISGTLTALDGTNTWTGVNTFNTQDLIIGQRILVGVTTSSQGIAGDGIFTRTAAATTGAIYLGNGANNYMYFNGTNFQFGTGGLYTNLATRILGSNATITGGATGNVPTLTAGPVTGNPTKWLPYDDNGTTRYLPAW